MIRQSYVYDEQTGLITPRPLEDSYRQRIQEEKDKMKDEREKLERLRHPGGYL